jgi:hypothetical protein
VLTVWPVVVIAQVPDVAVRGQQGQGSIEILNKKQDDENMCVVKYWFKEAGNLVPCDTPNEEEKAVEPEMITARQERTNDKVRTPPPPAPAHGRREMSADAWPCAVLSCRCR